MSKLTRTNAILPFTAYVDLTGKEGYFVYSQSPTEVGLVESDDDLSDRILGVIIQGAPAGEQVSVALSSGLAGTVKVKLSNSVVELSRRLSVDVGGTVNSSMEVGKIRVAWPLEVGVAGELIEAVLFDPFTE